MVSPLEGRIVERIRRDGPLRFDEYLELALYDPDDGFYERVAGAGRRRDFLTSPEVGPLFGEVLARAVDGWWDEAGRPDDWTVVDAGAGPGSLLRSLLAAGPRCGSVLRPVAVDRSTSQRADHDDRWISTPTLPSGPITGVIIANELLDNVPWRLLERTDRAGGGVPVWVDVHVDVDESGVLVEVLGPEPAVEADHLPTAPVGARLPLQEGAVTWLADALGRLAHGRCVVIDYADTTEAMAARPWSSWTRTYRAHDRGGHPLDGPGMQDITCEVATDQLAAFHEPDGPVTQAEFLRANGLDELVAEGRRVWAERAHLGDFAAMKARSRVSEAEALIDPAGLGAFSVLEWRA